MKPTGSGSDHWFCRSLPLLCSKCLHLELSAGPSDRHVKKPISPIRTFAVDLPAINLLVLQRQKESVSAASGALHLLEVKLLSGDLKQSFHPGCAVEWIEASTQMKLFSAIATAVVFGGS